MVSMDNWTMVQLRAECRALGITPGRGKVETVTRIMEARARPGNLGAAINAEAHSPGMDVLMRECDVVMEVKRSFDTPKPKDQAHRDMRRKMRKTTRQAQRRARGS